MKKEMTKITFARVEGKQHQIGVHEFTTWKEAEEHINRAALTVSGEGYDKCDFTVEFDADFEYRGRFDLEQLHSIGNNLEEQVVSQLKFYAGLHKPLWMSEEQYSNLLTEERKKECLEVMEKYAIGQEN